MVGKSVATVIGSGIQGSTIALQLAKKGYEVQLLERNGNLYQQASLNQEGKIHLGFIYAMDKSHRTSEKLLVDALNFAPIMDQLISDKINWGTIKSTKFHYLVAKDSMASVADLFEHYTLIEEKYRSIIADDFLHYLGQKPERLFTKVDKVDLQFAQDKINAIISTEEYAIDPLMMRQMIINELRRQSCINLKLGHEVIDIIQNESGYLTTCLVAGKEVQIKSEIVINAAWEQKRLIDQWMGIQDNERWSIRLKLGFVDLKPAKINMSSFSMVQGTYGDYVYYPHQNYIYYSWYPTGLIGQTSDLQIPEDWLTIIRGEIDPNHFTSIIRQTAIAFLGVMPQTDLANPSLIRAGAILARGERSILDPESELHQRCDPPILSKEGYFSVNTGKFTSAPINSKKLLEFL